MIAHPFDQSPGDPRPTPQPTRPGKQLVAAAGRGDIGGIREALANGADNLDEALCAAAEADQIQTAQYLIDAGANPNPREHNAFIVAANQGRVQIAQLFLERGADPNLYDILGWAAMSGSREVMELLLAAGADPIGRDNQPLRCAVGYKRVDIVRLLLERGADLDALPEQSRLWVEREALSAGKRLEK